MSADQGELFAEIGGLFEPEMLACTPVHEVRLLPGDHVEAMRGLEGSPATAERIRSYEAGRAERLHEIDQERDERYPVDEWDEHPCPAFKAEGADLWCTLCGWEAEDHETTPCEACGGPMWPGIDHDCPVPDIEHAETLAPDADPDQAWANAFTPSEGPTLDDIAGHDEDCPCAPCGAILGPLEHDEAAEDDAEHWTAEKLPTLAELVELLAPRVICDAWLSVSDHDATERLRRGLASGGCGGGRGMIQWENAGPMLQLFEGDGDELRTSSHRVCTWRDLAEALRAAETPETREQLIAALGAHARLNRADIEDPRPFVPAATLAADSVKALRHERDDASWRARHSKRLASKGPILDDLDQLRAEVVARIAAATAAPVSLF